MTEKVLTPREVAEALKVSRTTLWRYERAGVIPRRIRLSPRKTGFLKSEIEAFLNARANDRKDSEK